MTERIPYDELSFFHENAEEFGLPYDGPPVVHRTGVTLDDGRALSALVWGDEPAELVLLHGGAQNAHTWDTVAMAIGRPLVAIDLPGHGHSDGGRQGSAGLEANADDIATVVATLAPGAAAWWACRSAGSRRSPWPTATPTSSGAWSWSTSRPVSTTRRPRR